MQFSVFLIVYCLIYINLTLVLSVSNDMDGGNVYGLVDCDFEMNSCGWVSQKQIVYSNTVIYYCGIKGSLYNCMRNYWFQSAMYWNRTKISSIAKQLNSYGSSDAIFRSKQLSKIHDNFVISSTRDTFINAVHTLYQVNDVVSIEIPLSLSHRCLHYHHLVIGESASLVVDYITDYTDPYNLWDVLNIHSNTSVIQFSKASVTLPVFVNFKVVFRAIIRTNDSHVLLDNISIMEGMCEICGPNEFRCSSTRDECIPLAKVCDLETDCLEGEDEVKCDWSFIRSSCEQNQNLTSHNASQINGHGERDTPEVEETLYIPRENLCDDGYECPLNSSNKCYLICPMNCSCSGFSVVCSSVIIPKYATSITLTGVVHDYLEFYKGMYPNLKELNIFYSTIGMLNVSKKVTIDTISINHSKIGSTLLYTYFFRYLNIINSTFERVEFLDSTYYSTYYDFEFHVYNSSVSMTDSKLPATSGIRMIMLESQGFPYIVEKLSNFMIVNFSNCNLTYQPISHYETVTLDLSYNILTKWHILSIMQVLHLQHNLLSSINYTIDISQSEARLQYIDLSYNQIKYIENKDFTVLPNLLYLMLQHNFLENVEGKAFSKLSNLVYLDLSNNRLRELRRSHFIYLSNLKYLYLQNNNLKVVEGMFDGLMNILYLQVDSYTLCCAQPKAVSKIQCLAPVNELSSCSNLIDLPVLSIIIWYMALLSVVGNAFGTFNKLQLMRAKSITSFDIYSVNLGFADFCMGIYLYIIAGTNLKYSGRYGLEDDAWRHSSLCTFAGVLATLSSEASILFVLCITIDRILIIRFPISKQKRKCWIAIFISTFVWISSFLLSLSPLTGSEYFYDYYSSSAVCISLPLSVIRKPGWEYSMLLFVGANFIISIVILIGQIIIFMDLIRIENDMFSQQFLKRPKELVVAKTLIAVAVTDMFCWITIGTLGLLTFMGIDVASQVYVWVIVVVLPINSSLNPLIYTFSVIGKRDHRQNLSKTSSEIKTKEEVEMRQKSQSGRNGGSSKGTGISVNERTRVPKIYITSKEHIKLE